MGVWLKESKKKRMLDDIVQGLPFDERFQFPFTGKDAFCSPAYILPVAFSARKVTGFVAYQGRVSEISVGFCKRVLFVPEYYKFHEKCFVVQQSPDNNKMYLPLRLSEYKIKIPQRLNDGTCEELLFPVYGVHGTAQKRPLVFVSESENGLCYHVPYRSREGRVQTAYWKSGQLPAFSEEEMHAFLRSVHKKKVSRFFQQKTEVQQTPVQDEEVIDWVQPKSIVAYLDPYVIGQVHSKRVEAVVFSNYMTQVQQKTESWKKENLLLIGPTGSGKTYSISLLAKKAQLPFAQAKLSGKSSAGYVGENLSTVFEQISGKTNEQVPYGVVFFDEIDKLSMSSGSHDFFSAKLQDELIGWLEDAMITPERKGMLLSTKKLLFVLAGAFCGLEKIIAERLGQQGPRIGFHAQEKEEEQHMYELLLQTRPEDLIKYGMKPELVGRISAIGVFHPLSVDEKVHILTKSKESALEGYVQLLKTKGYDVTIDPGVVRMIAERCPQETGARALHSMCSDLFTNLLYEPEVYADANKKIHLTIDLVPKLLTLYK